MKNDQFMSISESAKSAALFTKDLLLHREISTFKFEVHNSPHRTYLASLYGNLTIDDVSIRKQLLAEWIMSLHQDPDREVSGNENSVLGDNAELMDLRRRNQKFPGIASQNRPRTKDCHYVFRRSKILA